MGIQITQIVKLFPFLLPVWDQRPLVHEDIMPTDYPIVVTAEEVTHQKQGLRLAGRELRATIIRQLRETAREDARKLLVDQLSLENDLQVKACLLNNLALMPFPNSDLCDLSRKLMKHADEDVRYWAVVLYAGAPAADVAVILDALANETSPMVRDALAMGLERNWQKGDTGAYIRAASDAHPRVARAAVTAACRKLDIGSHTAWLRSVLQGPRASLRVAVAREFAALPAPCVAELTPLLAADPHATVRATLAGMIPRRAEPALLPVLLKLLQDPDDEVRRISAESLVVYPVQETVAALARALTDARTLVRCQAEESLVAANSVIPVGTAAAAWLDADQAFTRYHVFRILGRLNCRQYAPEISRLLSAETDPVNVGAAVFALGCFDAEFAADAIAGLATHEAPIVRERVGEALGRLAVPSTYDQIRTLCFDAEDNVRQAAILATGRIGDGREFNATVQKVLEAVDEAKMASRNRCAAAWAASRLRPLSADLMDRLVVQATTPVVPGEMGEMLFETDEVLATIAFTIAHCARAEKSFLPQAEAVLKAHALIVKPGQPPSAASLLIPSSEIVEYARQARAHLEGVTPIEPRLRPVRKKPFAYTTHTAQDAF